MQCGKVRKEANGVSTVAIMVAAGRGTRAGDAQPKQWRTLAGQRVIDWSLAAVEGHPAIDAVVLVLHPDEIDRVAATPRRRIVAGGDSRSASVRAALDALAGGDVRQVLIHDVARPCLRGATIDSLLAALDRHDGAAPGLAITDALWRGDGSGLVTQTVPRESLFRAQTPQAFDYDAIMAAHCAHAGAAADDVEIALAADLKILITPGDPENIKITRPEDFDRVEQILKGRAMTAEAALPDIRLGNGFDVHRFGPGDQVTLCGVDIAHSRGLEGHSDADVGMHALTDAIYGALALGDIGHHFPPSDPQWKGAASRIFLEHAVAQAQARGYAITHVDCTLICEQPKIGPHAAAMRQRLAEIMTMSPDRISVKATTSEGLGFTGRSEGIAAIATATLVAT